MNTKKRPVLTAWKILTIVFLLIAAPGCAAVQQAPAPTETPTSAPSPTPRPTATVTALPEIPEGPFRWNGGERPLLLAHYMPWYQSFKVSGAWGWHWTMNHFTPRLADDGTWSDFASHYTPEIGLYDSSDEKVLEYQVLLMKLSGIDGVIVDWYGIENFWDYGSINASTGKLFDAVKKAGLKFVICYEDQTVKHMVANNHLKEADAIAHGQEVMRYLQETWFGDDAYLKVDGKPVLFTFGPQYYKNKDADWSQLFSVLDPPPAFITLDKNDVPLQAGFYPWPPMWASQQGVLSHDVLKSYLDDFYDRAEKGTVQVGGAFPGFHDIYKEAGVSDGYGYLDALDGKTFRFTLQMALDRQPDMIQLITWNDYGEGTNIEPTVQYGTRYLEMVQEARKATDGAFAYSAADLQLPLELYRLRGKHAADSAVNAKLDEAAAAIIAGDLAGAKKIFADFP